MGASYLIGILWALFSAASGRLPRFSLPLLSIPLIPGVAALCALLCALFIGELTTINAAAHSLLHLPSYVKTLPIPTIESGVLHRDDVDASRAVFVEAIGIVESLDLFFLALLLRSKAGHKQEKTAYFLIAFTALALGVCALSSPSMLGVDLYLYIGQAQAAPSPYHPNHTPLPGDAKAINAIWGNPLFPSAYGPLWIALSKAIIAWAPTLGAKLFALRFFELLMLASCLALLTALGKPAYIVALCAVNPAIYDVFVSEGHNDLCGVAFLLAAMLTLPRAPLWAIALTAAAGMIKLPFMLLGSLVFITEPSLFRRLELWLASASLTLLASAITGGPWYFCAMRRAYAIYAALAPPPLGESILHGVLAAIAIGALLLAFIKQRFVSGAAWSMLALGPYIPPQYLAWSFPYALAASQANTLFFATLPIAVYVLNTNYELTPFFIFLRAILTAIPMIGLIRIILTPQPPSARNSGKREQSA